MKPVPARLVAAGIAMARAAAIAVPVLTSAQSPAAITITVQEKVHTIVQDDVAPKSKVDRVSVGDRLVTAQALFDVSKKRIGTLYTGPGGLTIVGGSGAYAGAHGTVAFGKPGEGL